MEVNNIQLKVSLLYNQVFDVVMQLPPNEKQRLGDVLWSELNENNIEIPEEHKHIVRERIKKYENCTGSYLSWDSIEVQS